ncbi:MAG TPA: ferritin family protein, partial [Candidatus Margulisiibacteriota bacterium]|nr:ferritin family protein [Candidatus Margulisiibacteriota bacterium]
IDDKKVKNIFLTLSGAELSHREAFRSIAVTLRKEDLNEYSVDVSRLIRAHLELLKGLVFDMRLAREKRTGVPEALDIAIHTEREAIQIYSQMYRVFIEKFHEVLLVIIKEEKKHLELLNKVKSNLQI